MLKLPCSSIGILELFAGKLDDLQYIHVILALVEDCLQMTAAAAALLEQPMTLLVG